MLLLFIFSKIVFIDSLDICQNDITIQRYESGRLPNFAIPKEYRLKYIFNEEFTYYTGVVKIKISIVEKTSIIILHSHMLAIENVSLMNITKKGFNISKLYKILDICTVPKHQFLVIRVSGPFQVLTQVYLKISFYAKIIELPYGIYSSYVINSKGEQKKIVSTHFLPTYARTAFPCFDEPHMKAKFSLTAVYPNNYKMTTNTKPFSSKKYDFDRSITWFFRTPKMSTYLLAFIFHDYEQYSKVSTSGIKISVWLPREKQKEALVILEHIYTFFHQCEYFLKTAYPMDKLDIIEVPNLSIDAMENWGLIFSRILMYDIYHILTDNSDSIFLAVAKQWLGNLVSISWWNDVWLKEGISKFITLYFFKFTNDDYYIDEIMAEKMIQVMQKDELNSYAPLSLPNHTNNQKYDYIIISLKGNSLMSMLIKNIGGKKLFKYLQKYLHRFAYSNANSEDFWSLIKEETKDDKLYDVMVKFTTLSGFPVIKLEKDPKIGWYRITQQRMRFDSFMNSKNINDSLWTIPINYMTQKNSFENNKIWLRDKSNIFKLVYNDEFLILNSEFEYMYRVEYSIDMITKIGRSLNFNKDILTTVDKMLYISDLFTMLYMGKLDVDTTFKNLEFIKKESHPEVIAIFVDYVIQINDIVYYYDDVRENYSIFIMSFISHTIRANDFIESKNYQEMLLQSVLLKAVLEFNDAKTISILSDIYERKHENGLDVPNLYYSKLACIYIADNGRDEFKKYFIKYKTLNYINAKMYLYAMSCSRNPKLLYSILEEFIENPNFTIYDKINFVMKVSDNRVGAYVAMNFTLLKWKKFIPISIMYGINIDIFIQKILRFVSSSDQLKILEVFIIKNNDNVMKSYIENEMSKIIKRNVIWVKNNMDSLKNLI